MSSIIQPNRLYIDVPYGEIFSINVVNAQKGAKETSLQQCGGGEGEEKIVLSRK